jgi:hypothetical protein
MLQMTHIQKIYRTELLESFEHGTYMLDGEDVSRMSDARVSSEEMVQSQDVIPQAAQLSGGDFRCSTTT